MNIYIKKTVQCPICLAKDNYVLNTLKFNSHNNFVKCELTCNNCGDNHNQVIHVDNIDINKGEN
ncbi:MAG: hypothetical protein ACOCP4_01485 [Candidatus Woesearchaeota archaeon]